MDAALLTLVIALAAAAGCALVAWRAVDDQRRRSAARVAALAAAIDGEPDAPASRLKPAPTTDNSIAPSNSIASTNSVVGAGFRRLDDRPVAVSSMFSTAPGAAVRGRPLIKAAVVAAMAVALVVVVAMANRDHAESATVPVDAAPLELMSMRHTRNGDTLTVTGLVRNPRAGDTVASIAAVVFAFNRNGAFVTSAQAPLDFLTLGPGDESPFIVTIPNVGDVGRYRVSFRTDAGVMRHVDRRAAQVASTPADGDRQVSVN